MNRYNDMHLMNLIVIVFANYEKFLTCTSLAGGLLLHEIIRASGSHIPQVYINKKSGYLNAFTVLIV